MRQRGEDTADPSEIERTLGFLLEPGAVAELWLWVPGRAVTISGYYDDYRALASDAAPWSGHAQGVFVTLNPVHPALHARAPNRLIRQRIERPSRLAVVPRPWLLNQTTDDDILRRRWLPIDIDARTPYGVGSTEIEHRAALAGARLLRTWLRGKGWPEPVLADSGNGAHLLYRLDLPNDAESATLIETGLAALDLRFTDRSMIVDASVANAARLWKIYGTHAAKGTRTRDRPHRMARVLTLPPQLEPVPRPLLAALPRRPRWP